MARRKKEKKENPTEIRTPDYIILSTPPKNQQLTLPENYRKKIAAELILGGFEIQRARLFMGITKMPMQYYLKVHGLQRPKIGDSQNKLRIGQIYDAITLLAHGATPKEIFDLTGVSMNTLYKLLPTAQYSLHQKTHRPQEDEIDDHAHDATP